MTGTHLATIRGTQGRHVEVGQIITVKEISEFDKKVLQTLHEMVCERREYLAHKASVNPFFKYEEEDTAVRAIDLKNRLRCTSTQINRAILKMSNLWHEPIFEGKRGTYTTYGI